MNENGYKILADNLGEYSIVTKDNIIVVTELEDKAMAELICEELNVLYEDNERIFNLIDVKIDELEKKYEFGQNAYNGCPMHNIQFGINILKELKKELEE